MLYYYSCAIEVSWPAYLYFCKYLKIYNFCNIVSSSLSEKTNAPIISRLLIQSGTWWVVQNEIICMCWI